MENRIIKKIASNIQTNKELSSMINETKLAICQGNIRALDEMYVRLGKFRAKHQDKFLKDAQFRDKILKLYRDIDGAKLNALPTVECNSCRWNDCD